MVGQQQIKEGRIYNSKCAAVKESKCVGADAVQSGRARLLICQQKSVNDSDEKCVHAGPRRACVGHLAQLSRPQTLSENKTNNPLKSSPALARPAGPAPPPLLVDTGLTGNKRV